jgi:hypothetical protein
MHMFRIKKMLRVVPFLPFCARGVLGPVVAVGAILAALVYAASIRDDTTTSKS